MKIIDCFIFQHETELIQYRLNLLNHVVDYFVIVESAFDFTGKPKKMYSLDIPEFETFRDKIVHIQLKTSKYSKYESWKSERYQRNCLFNGIDTLNLKDEDVILISNINEFPDPNMLRSIQQHKIRSDIYSLEMNVYHLNTLLSEKWYFAKMIPYKKYKELSLSCDTLRNRTCPILKNGGWRLLYHGDKV